MTLGFWAALLVLGGLGLLFGTGLAVAAHLFAVQKDERVLLVEAVLPGANCGACGAPGCAGFAEGVVSGRFPVTGCVAGGKEVAARIATILGVDAGEVVSYVAVVQCRGDKEACPDRAVYQGIEDCRAAHAYGQGAKGCVYGCLGLGTCVAACPFDAMVMDPNGLPRVIESRCTGCGECVRVCPRQIMALIPRSQRVFMACRSLDFGKAVKAVCRVGCIGCGLCANPKVTPHTIITMENNLPRIHYERMTDPWEDLKQAVEKCPTHSFGVRDERTASAVLRAEEAEVDTA